ncbi:phage head-tail connector protein [Paenibacillus albicereus]|uniref:Phage head-tail connector protein n=1 Tax=Paenibacillus albicereus TaxID=2726185 RepID=A0A6H2GZF1_9BACL|nr:phage head-tail connector protein [Paenibacillus albicereus]QJC52790.1 phage head-tail connector protein [Paenibacillus albicereus]
MLTTLSKAKQQLLIMPEDSSADEQVALYLQAASEAVELYCRRSFELKERTELCSGLGSTMLPLRAYPVASILTVGEPEQLITNFVELEDGMLFRKEHWPRGIFNIPVRYTGGFVLPSDEPGGPEPTLPKSIELACLLLCKLLYSGEWGKVSERIGDYSVTYDKGIDGESPNLPRAVRGLLRSHVRRWR